MDAGGLDEPAIAFRINEKKQSANTNNNGVDIVFSDNILKNFKSLILDSVPPQKSKYRINEMIFRQGDCAKRFFIIEEGNVSLERYTVEGRKVILHTASAGESFAEAALFSDVYHCNAISKSVSQVLSFSKEEVLFALRQNPETAISYIAHLSSQVQDLRTRLELTNILSARERIIRFLLLSIDPQTGIANLNNPLKELAAELGLAHETFYRELKKLEKEKFITRTGRQIKIASLPENRMIEII